MHCFCNMLVGRFGCVDFRNLPFCWKPMIQILIFENFFSLFFILLNCRRLSCSILFNSLMPLVNSFGYSV